MTAMVGTVEGLLYAAWFLSIVLWALVTGRRHFR